MNYIISKSQLLTLIKESHNKKVVCNKCGWSWNLSDGGKDPYTCHKCGYKNEVVEKKETKEGEIMERCWKGYTQKGMKTMFGKKYPNCVKVKK